MNISQLKEEAQKAFDALAEEKTQHETRLNEIVQVMTKLQGEYAAYEKLDMEAFRPVPEEATTVTVKEKKNGTK